MWLQWLGFIAGTIGMLLWAINIPQSKWAGVFWTISSICWIVVGIEQQQLAMILRDLINLGFFIFGMWRWIVK